MKIGKGRDGHDDEFGDVLEMLGWWLRLGVSDYRPLNAEQLWFMATAAVLGRLPEGRRYIVRREPKPFAEREARARLRFPAEMLAEHPIHDLAGPEEIERFDIGFWTRWGAERHLRQGSFNDRDSWYGPPELVR